MPQFPPGRRLEVVTGAFTREEARRSDREIGIDRSAAPFGVDELRCGLGVELEHGPQDLGAHAAGDDPDYYRRLERMEEAAKRASI